MSDEQRVNKDKLEKALASLEQISKGHSSRGTVTTEVDSMRDGSAGAGASAGSTQVHHTESNSNPGGWAGSTQMHCPDDGATDAVQEDGTDYTGGAQMVKSILRKLHKGMRLTSEEMAVYNSIIKAQSSEDDDSDAKDVSKAGSIVGPSDYKKAKSEDADDDDDDDDEMDKSLEDYAQSNQGVREGFEVSDFLKGWSSVQDQALRSTESRIVRTVQKSLNSLSENQSQYNTELAKSLHNLAEVMMLQEQRIEQLESTPARAPKSHQVSAVSKSFGPGGAPQEESLTKAQILDTMEDMVEKGKISATDVIKFESTSGLPEPLERQVRKHLSG